MYPRERLNRELSIAEFAQVIGKSFAQSLLRGRRYE